MHKHLGILLLAISTLSSVAQATAPDRRSINAAAASSGGIVAARIPVAAGQNIRWLVQPASGVRVLGATEGMISGRDALAITFALPRNQPAGMTRLAVVHVRGSGIDELVDVFTHVAARRAIAAAIQVTDSVRPGEVAGGTLRISNGGTGADTVALLLEVDRGWRVEGVPAQIVVQAGATYEGRFRVRVPADAQIWSSTGMRLTARGIGARAVASGAIHVVPERGANAEQIRLPFMVYAGLSAGDAGALQSARSNVGVSAAGAIGATTHVDLLVQDNEVGFGAIAMAGIRSNTVMRGRVRSDNWSATVGDAASSAGLLPRFYAAGRGIDASWRNDRFDARAALLFPRVGWGFDRSGQVINAGAGVQTGMGRFGIALLQAERAPELGGVTGTGRSAALQYHLFSGAHALQVEGGWIDARTSAGTQGGAAAEGSYRYSGVSGSLAASFRTAPGTALLGGGIRNEAALSGALALGRRLGAQANVYSYETTPSDFTFFNELGEQRVRVGPSAMGGSAGLQWRDRATTAGVAANVLRRETPGSGDLRRTISMNLGQSFGELALHGTAEVGERLPDAGATMNVQRFRGSVSWTGTTASIWASVENSNEGPPLAVALNGSLRLGAAELTAVLNTFRDSLSLPATTFASTLSYGVTPTLALRAGAEYRPWAIHQASPWAVSLGVRRTIGVPLPVRSRNQFAGIIYDDANANGRRDAGERGLEGVPVSIGTARAVSDEQGRFRLSGTLIGSLTVSERALAVGTMVRPGFEQQGGYAEIPVVRTGELIVTVTLNERTAVHASAGAGVTVRLQDAAGRKREATTDTNGVARFPALLPGSFTIEAEAELPGTIEGTASAVQQVEITPGDVTSAGVALTYRKREVRFLRN